MTRTRQRTLHSGTISKLMQLAASLDLFLVVRDDRFDRDPARLVHCCHGPLIAARRLLISNLCAPTSVVRDLEKIAAGLAMHRVGIMTLQRALWAGKEYLQRPEN